MTQRKTHQNARPVPQQSSSPISESRGMTPLPVTTFGSATKLLLTVQEAANALRVSRSSLYKLLLTGEIPSIKVGRMRRIPLTSLKEWVTDQLAA